MKIDNCLISKYGITCIEKTDINILNYITSFCILRICEELIKHSIYNLKIIKKDISFLDGVAFS